MKIAVTGASGFLGRVLCESLEADGHTLLRIGRGAESDVQWNPARGILDAGKLEGVDAVINLAGSAIARRWTAERRRELRDSRVQSTRLISQAIASLERKPMALLSGSSVGIYGSRGDEVLDDTSSSGADYLAELGREWESCTRAAEAAGIRVAHLRTGIVLHPDGGALAKMLLPFQLGVGGPLGSGKQWMSWISREDWVRAVKFVLHTDALRGPVSIVGPEPVTSATFASTLARILGRPSLMRVPAFALKLLYGEMAEATVLASQRVMPRKLEDAGFQFEHRSLATALRAGLGL